MLDCVVLNSSVFSTTGHKSLWTFKSSRLLILLGHCCKSRIALTNMCNRIPRNISSVQTLSPLLGSCSGFYVENEISFSWKWNLNFPKNRLCSKRKVRHKDKLFEVSVLPVRTLVNIWLSVRSKHHDVPLMLRVILGNSVLFRILRRKRDFVQFELP